MKISYNIAEEMQTVRQCNDDFSKSADTTMGFAIKDKHFIKW